MIRVLSGILAAASNRKPPNLRPSQLPKSPKQENATIVGESDTVVSRPPSPVVELRHMLTQQDLDDDNEYNDILEDTRDECSSFGTLKNIVIPRKGPGATKIFLEYMTAEDAGKAIAGLAGRTFDGRKVTAVYFDTVKFANEDYSD